MRPSHIAHRLTQAATHGLQSRPAKQVQPVRSGARGGSPAWVGHASPEDCRLNLRPGINGTSLRLDAGRGTLQRLAEVVDTYLHPDIGSLPPAVHPSHQR
ncbi:hypothetical protein FALCPG4_009278 [Fusarium falciforme]